jgi:threonylcarbamoyladenosine tRNA methylthiotransferase MtaB
VKYAVVTFGCRVNQADSLGIEDRLRARGGIDAPPGEADLVVVNTCSVTASADQSARQVIRRLARANPQARVVVTGCYATRRPAELAALPNVIRVVANDHKDDLVGSLDFTEFTTAERYGDGDGPCGAHLQPGVAGRTALTLRVQTGCDEACSYCVIPSTRGVGRSRPLAGVLDDVRRATDAGYKEIAITGVHLGSYGRDLGDGTTLDRLVEALAGSPGDALFRISSLEPMDCTPALVALVAASPRLAPHFHLPLQHGSDAVLGAMRRPYSVSFYRDLVERIHARLPDASIGTDIIVGFPGETEEDASATLALLASLPLSHLHVFPYSDRPGTDASAMSGRPGGAVVRARAGAVREVGARLSRTFQERQLGTVHRALTLDDGTRAVTDNFLKLRLPPGWSRNEWVDVRIGGKAGALKGTPVSH